MSKNKSKDFLYNLKNENREKFYQSLTKGYLEFFYNTRFKNLHFRELKNLLIYKYSLFLNEKLTLQEMRCLYLAGLGKSIQEMSYLLSIVPKTVEEHRSSLLKKLDANNMPQAVMKGFYLFDIQNLNLSFIPGYPGDLN